MIILDGNSLTIEEVARVARREEIDIRISEEAKANIAHSRELVEDWVERGEIIYGITTGFGEFANVTIPRDELRTLQQNLLRSHSAGVGEPLAPEIVRAMLLLRANALAKGFSGVRLVVIEQLLKFLAEDILPVIPSRGSVGSSGDLAPLAHLALALTGEGSVTIPETPRSSHGTYQSHRTNVKALEALADANIQRLTLEAKEGLALINGTQMMSAIGCLMLHRAKQLAEIADISASVSFEALRTTDRAFDPRIHAARPHKGQQYVAAHMLRLVADSEIRKSHLENDPRVQDAYSIRCIPQVHGAVRDTIEFVERTLSIEINSATDNPLIIPNSPSLRRRGPGDGFSEQEGPPLNPLLLKEGEQSGDHLEGGNFHGEPIALAFDYLAIALSELASISERRTERLVNGALSNGLPRFLAKHGGLNSGLMIAQYTAAALVSENKVLAHPASVDSIPTSGNMEDHNSMGSISALKLRNVVKNVETVLAIELMCAAQGIDFLAPLKPGTGSGKAHELIRARVPTLDEDRVISMDISEIIELIEGDRFIEEIKRAIV